MSDDATQRRTQRVSDLLALGRALPPERRDAWLREACIGDDDLFDEVSARLLRSSATTQPAPAEATPADGGEAADEWGGRRLGDTTLGRLIAGGGMGVVYEGTQDPPGRKVAVKLLRSGFEGEEATLRFRQEAHLLANLRHPGIAQIFEAGTYADRAGDDVPYFVMEYVPGAKTLVDFARHRALDAKQRLRLFARVCEAVHFGHVKGVIHRDLKPGNILVDADGNPKVIDFGIARSTQRDPATTSPRTETGQLVGTLPYMSPEQLLGPSDDLDLRSDVYALGVILYELLVDRLPYDLEGLGLVEAAGTIVHKAPVPVRRIDPDLAGDVEVILEKALAKDPARRYASADAFREDIERFLTATPILARPPSLVYQMRLFTRRHKGLVASGVLALAALVVATVVSLRSAHEQRLAREAADRATKQQRVLRELADRQRERAERLLAESNTLVPWLLRDFDKDLVNVPGPTLTARTRLAERLRQHVDALFVTEGDQREVMLSAARARLALGEMLGGGTGSNLGRRTEALVQLREGIDLLEKLIARDPRDLEAAEKWANALLAESIVAKELGDFPVSGARIERALAWAEERLRQDPASETVRALRLTAWNYRANLSWAQSQPAAALRDYRRFLEEREAHPRLGGEREVDRDLSLLQARLNVGTTLLEMGAKEEAEPLVATLLDDAQRLAGPTPDGDVLRSLYYVYKGLGSAWLAVREVARAEPAMTQALSTAQRWADMDAANAEARISVSAAHSELGRLARDQGRYEDSAEHYRVAGDLATALAANDPPESNPRWDVYVNRRWEGEAAIELGQFARAEKRLGEARGVLHERWAALPEDRYAPEALMGVEHAFVRLYERRYGRFRNLVDSVPYADIRTPAARRYAVGLLKTAIEHFREVRRLVAMKAEMGADPQRVAELLASIDRDIAGFEAEVEGLAR